MRHGRDIVDYYRNNPDDILGKINRSNLKKLK